MAADDDRTAAAPELQHYASEDDSDDDDSAAELRRRQEEERRVEANERAAREYQAHYDAEAQRGGDSQNPSYASIDEVYAASAAGVTVAAARNNPVIVQPLPQVYDALSSSDDDTADAPAAASSVAAGAAAAASASGTRERSNTNISMSSLLQQASKKVSSIARLLNCKRPSPHGERHDTMFIRSETNAKNVKAKKTRQEPAVVDTTPFVPQGQINDLYALLCTQHPAWVEVVSQSSTKQSPKDHREVALPNAFNGDKLAEVLIHILMNFPSNSSKTKEKILTGGIAYLNDEGIPGQVSWHSIIFPLIKIMEKYYGATRAEAIEKVRKHVAYGNRVPIMADPQWSKKTELRRDYNRCVAITDAPMRRIYVDAIKSFPNLAAAPVFGKSPFKFVNGGAFQDPLFGDKLIQNSTLPHGSQLNNGFGINKEQRDDTLLVLNKIAAILMNVDEKPIPDDEDERSDILPYSVGELVGGIEQNSRGEYITSLVDGINGLSSEQIEGVDNIDDDFLGDGRSRAAITKSLNREIELGQEATVHTYICTICAKSRPCQYNHYHSGCKKDREDGYYRLLRLPNGNTIDPLFRGYCVNTECDFTGRFQSYHLCPVAGKRLRLTSLTPPPGFTIKTKNQLLIRKIMAHSGELVGSSSSAADAARDFIDEAPRQGITTLPPSTLNQKIKKIKFENVNGPFRSMILGEECLQNGTVQLGNVIYQGVPICLPTTDAADDNGNDDDDDDDDGDSSDGRKKPAASAPTKSFGSQMKLAAIPWAKKQSAAPKKSDKSDDDRKPAAVSKSSGSQMKLAAIPWAKKQSAAPKKSDKSDDDRKPAAVSKSSGSQMKLDSGTKKLCAPPMDSKSKSRTVGKSSGNDGPERIEGCDCGPKSKCSTVKCTCRQVNEACDPKRCKCNCEICENKGRKSSGDKGDDKGKKRQMKLSFFGKKSG